MFGILGLKEQSRQSCMALEFKEHQYVAKGCLGSLRHRGLGATSSPPVAMPLFLAIWHNGFSSHNHPINIGTVREIREKMVCFFFSFRKQHHPCPWAWSGVVTQHYWLERGRDAMLGTANGQEWLFLGKQIYPIVQMSYTLFKLVKLWLNCAH